MQATQEKNSFRRTICQKPFEPFGQIDGRALVDLVGTGDQARVCRKLCQQPERLLCAELLIAFRHKDRIFAAQIRRQRFRRVKKRRSCDLKPLRIFVAKAAQQRAEAQALAAENGYYDESSSNPYNDILADTYESAYARRLRGFESPTYRMPSSYYNFRYGSSFTYATAYDPAFYNIIISGDEVWVEPKYITSMFGTWGGTPYGGWYFGWNYSPSWWGYPSYAWGGWNWGFGFTWYDPWWGPGWHPYWGPGWGPGWGGGWHGHHHAGYRPRDYYGNPGGRGRSYTPGRSTSGARYGNGGYAGGSRGGRNGSYSTSYGSRNGDSPFSSGSRGSSYNNRGSSYNNRGNSYNSGSRGDFNSGSRNDFNSGSRGSSYNDRGSSGSGSSFNSGGSRGGSSGGGYSGGGSRGGSSGGGGRGYGSR